MKVEILNIVFFQLMSTLQLKSSKFDVSREGLLNVYYKHPKNSSAKVRFKLSSFLLSLCHHGFLIDISPIIRSLLIIMPSG